jgi:hypothetical protein
MRNGGDEMSSAYWRREKRVKREFLTLVNAGLRWNY